MASSKQSDCSSSFIIPYIAEYKASPNIRRPVFFSAILSDFTYTPNIRRGEKFEVSTFSREPWNWDIMNKYQFINTVNFL